jgi:phosphatidylglycerophosphatase A
MQTDPDLADPPGVMSQRPGGAAHHGQPAQAEAWPHCGARFMLSHPLHLLSFGLGSGLSGLMPGTMATLFAWLSFTLLDRFLGAPGWGVLIGLGLAAGVIATGYTARELGNRDPRAIVWDKILAFWLILLMVTPASFAAQCGAFVLFRGFGVLRPPPIGHYERRLKGGLGVMADDLLAAFFTLMVIALWRNA